ncbi:MAG TPA: glycosyltransferase [Candidatus Sulfotelmatobacter sp.]|nr:glycosyltransferase [Candidatus Sulfotelmatobacter sp.]HEV2417253.1 glycosyltransferase [Terriglobia bacterium]
MRVLHVEVGGSYGGSLRALELYLAHSHDANLEHDVLFYFPTPHSENLLAHVNRVQVLYPEHSPRSRQVAGTSVQHKSVSSPWIADLKKLATLALGLPTAFRVRQVILDRKYDVVHVNNTFTYQAATLIGARWAGTPVVAHVRNPVDKGSLARWLLRMTDRLVCVNDVLRQSLVGWETGLAVVTCRDAVEEITFDVEASRVLRQSLAARESLLVGSLGRLEPQKGFAFLVKAARNVIDQMPDVKFAIAGDGSERGNLEALIRALGIEKNFLVLNFRSDVGNFIEALDIFIVSSIWEGGPLTALEAMQLGKPIVTTPVGFMPELIKDHENGLLVLASDVDSLAQAILELCKTEGLRSSLSAAAPEAVKPFRDRDALARALDKVFTSLVLERDAG